METRRRLHRMEIELAQLKQELNDDRKARERAEALVKEVAENGQKSITEATQKLISTEAELEAIRRLMEEERERFNTIQSEASERQKEAVVAQKTNLQELDKEREARSHAEVYAREVAAKAQQEVVDAIKQSTLSIQKLGAAEAELQTARRALDEERERCEQIKSEASEKQREAVVAQQKSFQEMASAREAASKAQEEIAEAMENARRVTEKLSDIELELEASRQALDEERERCKQVQSEASEKLEEAITAQKTNFKELEDERKARALAEASLREERDEAVKQANLSTNLLSAAEAELEATCQALAEEREHSKRIQIEASKTQSELLLCLENDVKELNDERKARIYTEKCARDAAAKARDEIAEAVRQSSLANQKFVAADAELEATRKILAEERHRNQKIQLEACEKQKEALLSQRTTFLKQLKAQVDTAEKALLWDAK